MSAWWLLPILAAVGLCFVCAGLTLAWSLAVRRMILDIRKARDLTGEVVELQTDLEALRQSVKRLHSRAGMREIREARANGDRPPDWQKDAEGFLRYHQARINRERMNGA